jgi:cell division transport system permease protein
MRCALEDNPLPHHLIVRPAHTPAARPRWNPAPLLSRPFPRSKSCSSTSTGCAAAFAARRLKRALWVVDGVLGTRGARGHRQYHPARDPAPAAEIEVTKLVGGSNAFVRRPFLYTGCSMARGARLAALIVSRGHGYLEQSVGELSAQYGGRFRWTAWAPKGLASSSAVGLAWAGWAPDLDRQHLRPIEPRA